MESFSWKGSLLEKLNDMGGAADISPGGISEGLSHTDVSCGMDHGIDLVGEVVISFRPKIKQWM